MKKILERQDIPADAISVPGLDFSRELLADRIDGEWFRLGSYTVLSRRDTSNVEDFVMRQCLLIPTRAFSKLFDRLKSVGSVLQGLGKPVGTVTIDGQKQKYNYSPFYKFNIPFSPISGEPVVYLCLAKTTSKFFINPDLWLYLELEEKPADTGIWWDPSRGEEVIRRRLINEDTLEIVEIRTKYLMRYLKSRQLSLLVGQFRHLHMFDPEEEVIAKCKKGELILGSARKKTKAIIQVCGLRTDITRENPFLQNRLHLWFEIPPPSINLENPWTEAPSFDLHAFTLPTINGLVAPGRFHHEYQSDANAFEGVDCDYLDRIFFRQDVLTKYEGASGFSVGDDGSVVCQDYWGLHRGTMRIGNELISTAIGDFVEGIPFEEWPHWKQYVVEPPSSEIVKSLSDEQTIASAVNRLVSSLEELNEQYKQLSLAFGTACDKLLWNGSLNSLAGRQIKWVYASNANDEVFLTRATLVSTLVLDELNAESLRNLLNHIAPNLHLNNENPPKSLGSRKLLQRLVLVCLIIQQFKPKSTEIFSLVIEAERKEDGQLSDLQRELRELNVNVCTVMEPLAFLYDLRLFGGLAHSPNIKNVSSAAASLGLPPRDWHRTHFLNLLNLIRCAILRIGTSFENAIEGRTFGP
ncbi:MAG: hypothetical protein K2Y22_03945 [Candidatus Obscuribacterales bacterium]|nr:hypothetical protein [Candidatus Obscuribacterales bacterium]